MPGTAAASVGVSDATNAHIKTAKRASACILAQKELEAKTRKAKVAAKM